MTINPQDVSDEMAKTIISYVSTMTTNGGTKALGDHVGAKLGRLAYTIGEYVKSGQWDMVAEGLLQIGYQTGADIL